MIDAFAEKLNKVTGGDSEEMARINRATNFALITGQSVSSAYDDHDVLTETVNEKKTFFGELHKARANKKQDYHPLKTFNPDAPAGTCPVTGTTAKDHAALWYPLVKGFIDTGHSAAEGLNMSMSQFFSHLDQVGSFMGRHLGGDAEAGKGGLFRDAAGYFQNNYEGLKKLESKLPAPVGGVSQFAGETVGSAPFGIASFILDKAFAGPAAAQGEVERRKAISEQNNPGNAPNISTVFETPESEAEFWAFTKGAIERGLMGAIFHGMAGASRGVRVPATGALFGEQAHSQGADRTGEDYWKAVITGGLFGTMGGKGKFDMRDIADEIVNINKEMGQRGSIGREKKTINGFRVGAEKNDVAFSSKNKDYTEEYARTKGIDQKEIKPVTYEVKNPLIIELSQKEFSDPVVEKKYIDQAINDGNDVVIFKDNENGDEFYARIKEREIPPEPIDDINELLAMAARQDKATGVLPENPSYEAIRQKAAEMAFAEVSKKIENQRKRQAAQDRRAGEDSARLAPVSQAMDHIVKAGGLSRESLSKDYDADTIKELTRKRPGLVRKEGGQALDVMADQFGFASGDTFINSMLDWKGIKAEGEGQAKAFEKFFYDKINENDLNDFHIKTLEAEQKILSKLLKGNEPKPASGLKKFIREETGQVNTEAKTLTESEALAASMKKAEQASRQAFKAGVEKGKEISEIEPIVSIKQRIRQETGQVRAGELAVTEYGALTAGLKKAAAASRMAFREGKIEGAYAENQRQLEMAYRTKARTEAKSEISGIIKDLKGVQKDVKTMTPGNADKVQELLDCIDLSKLSTRKQLELEATRKFLANNPNTEMPSYVFDDLARLDKVAARDLTYDELKSVHMAIMQYAHNSELANKIYDGREMRDKAEVLNKVIGEMAEPGEKTGDLIRLKPSLMDKASSWSEWVRNTLGIRQDSYRLIVESISGPNSTVDAVFGRAINEGNDTRMKYRQDTQAAFREDLAAEGFENGKSDKHGIKDITTWLDEFQTVKLDSGVSMELMRGQVMALYRHSLNPDNRAAIVAGGIGIKRPTKSSKLTPNDVIKITDNDLDRIISGMKPEELAFAGRAVDNLFENQWNSLNDVFVRVNHYRSDKQENYYPKEVMPLHRGGMLAEVEEGMEPFRQYTARVGIHKGFMIERVGSKAPIYLNHIMHDITNSIEKSAAYIGLEEPMRRASSLLYNPNFAYELSQRYNPATWKLIEGGLKDIAGQGREFNETERGILKMRTNAVSGIVALNPWIWMNQPAGFILFNSYVEGKYLSKGLVDTALHPAAVTKSLRDNSPMLTDRMNVSYDRDLSKQFTQSRDVDLYGGKTSLVQKGISPTKYIDVAAIIPGMQAATYKALAEFERGKMSSPVKQALGITDAEVSKLTPEEKVMKAHEFADWVVENTQAMAGKEHQSPMQRGGTIEQIITSFGSQTNAMLNLSRRTWRQYQRTKDPEDLKTFTKAALQIFIVNAAFMYGVDAVRNALYGRENKTVTEGVVDNAAGMVFGLRDIEKMAMSHLQHGRQGFDAKYPVTKIYEIMGNMATDFNTIATSKNQKNIEEAWFNFMDQIIASAALAKGLPYETPKKVGKSILFDDPPNNRKDGAIDVLEDEILEDIGLEE